MSKTKPTLDELAHYGVKGMKWGVRTRSDRPSGTPRRTERMAKRDAKEAARAKMFYGEGAGTRRKLINKSVEARAKRDPAYKEAYERNLAKQDLSKHANKAISERRRKDTTKSAVKTARGIKNLALRTGAPVTLSAAIAYRAYQDPAVKAAIQKLTKQSLATARKYNNTRKTADVLRRMGIN